MGHSVIESVRVQDPTNRQYLEIFQATDLLVALSGASVDSVGLIPAGSLVLGMTARVTTTITGATTWDLGVVSPLDVDAFGAALALGVDTLVDLTDITQASPLFYAAAADVRLTGNGGSFSGGDVRITVHYIALTAPAD